ncbi:unnamed protein product [Adineta ricciae]|uniref:Uncharacterized protein n=1 Tax=Adineta ricciae TaxID=249248 RepID=A0A815T1T3_ADIRI|nr:unnamed protein product [Adineta ricciae]CAF1500464.1 unnamed protein product [Adineta ricciae]
MTTTLTCLSCKTDNVWNNNQYKQGLIYNCWSCSVRMQQIFCPHCSQSNTWLNPSVSVEGCTVTCGSCAKTFQFICCPHCQNVNVWSAANYTAGLTYNCYSCTRPFQHISCIHCQAPNVYPTEGSIQGQRLECHSCHKTHQYVTCPHCNKEQIWKDCNYTPGTIVPCWSCKGTYAHMRCPHCEKANFWKNPKNTSLSNVCCYCKIDMCTAVSTSKSVVRTKSSLEKDKTSAASSVDKIQRSLTDMNIGQARASSSRRGSSRPGRSEKLMNCSYFAECLEYVKALRWSSGFFDRKHNRCYCHKCYSSDLPNILQVADSNYVVPRGWAGFGLGVDPFRGDDLWSSWIVVYHGTTPLAAQSIITHRAFLLPGDSLLDGTELAIRPGHIPGKVHIYTSPSIRYASLEVYSQVKTFTSPKTNKQYKAQLVMQCKQKPGTFDVQGETVGWGHKPICDIIPNKIIEHFSNRRSSVVPYRLLIRLEDA